MRGPLFSARLLTLLDALNANGVEAIPLKGPTLAGSLYPEMALRPCCDLDLLVRPRHVETTFGVLAEAGFALPPHLARIPARSLQGLVCEAEAVDVTGLAADVHWALAPGSFPFALPTDLLWRETRPVRLLDRHVKARLVPTALACRYRSARKNAPRLGARVRACP